MNPALLFVVGLAVLYAGAEFMVRGASRLALSMGVSAIAVGLTVVAYGTSAPELVVGVMASAKGQSDLVYGNVIGSNIANLALVLGIAVLIRRLPVHRSFRTRRIPFLLAVSSLPLLLSLNGWIGFNDGLVFVALLVVYLAWEGTVEFRRARLARKNGAVANLPDHVSTSVGARVLYAAMTLAGIAGLAGGAEMMVRGAVQIAENLGISERIIGITIVALGTSLPELAATVVAVARKEADLLLGGLVGSNVFNILIIVGVCSLISPIPIALSAVAIDFAFLLGLPVVLYVLALRGDNFPRPAGALLLGLYVVYIALLFV